MRTTSLSAAYAASTLEQGVKAAQERRRELASQFRRNEVIEEFFALDWQEQEKLLSGQPTLRMTIGQYREEKAAYEAEKADR